MREPSISSGFAFARYFSLDGRYAVSALHPDLPNVPAGKATSLKIFQEKECGRSDFPRGYNRQGQFDKKMDHSPDAYKKSRSFARNRAHSACMVLRRQRLRTKTVQLQISPMSPAAMSPDDGPARGARSSRSC
jgi:hypothetical protein